MPGPVLVRLLVPVMLPEMVKTSPVAFATLMALLPARVISPLKTFLPFALFSSKVLPLFKVMSFAIVSAVPVKLKVAALFTTAVPVPSAEFLRKFKVPASTVMVPAKVLVPAPAMATVPAPVLCKFTPAPPVIVPFSVKVLVETATLI